MRVAVCDTVSTYCRLDSARLQITVRNMRALPKLLQIGFVGVVEEPKTQSEIRSGEVGW
jgi:hypothetical protein